MALTTREIDLSEDEIVELVKVATFPQLLKHSIIIFLSGWLCGVVVRPPGLLPLPRRLGTLHIFREGLNRGRRTLKKPA